MRPQRDDVERLARRADLARRRAERLAVRATELERVRAALEGHSREVEHSLARRSRFFASVSHELRTPINTILGYNDLLRQGIYGALTEAQREVVEKVTSSAWQLLHLVDDTLDLARLEAGKLTLLRRSVDLASLAAEAVAAVEVAAHRKGLTFRLERDAVPTVHTDPARVRQVLFNLLSNAVKFTDEGEVALEVRHLPSPAPPRAPARPPGRDGWVALTVRDSGAGIPGEQLGAIFQAFVQLPRAGGGAEGGAGLGLTIASRIARLLGGELFAESELGVRSAFTLFLPCPAPPPEADGP